MTNPVGAVVRAGVVVLIAATGFVQQGAAQSAQIEAEGTRDRYVNYYYPPPQGRETYRSPAATLAEANRNTRLGFVTALTRQMLSNPYPPPFAMFAKGEGADKLIVVSLTDGGYNSLYRARALFAMLTAVARLTPFFRENAVDDLLTFFDLAKLLGFSQITWTDGKRLAHQILLE